MASKPLTPEVARASLSVRVSSLISVQLARGKVGVEVVASQLHMSRYTLHKNNHIVSKQRNFHNIYLYKYINLRILFFV